MNTCFICQTSDNLVHSGTDALLLECLDRIAEVCYECANRNRGFIKPKPAVKLGLTL